MKKLVVTVLFAGVLAFAQEAGHGAAPAQPGAVASSPAHEGQSHAESAAQPGEGHGEQAMPYEIWWKWANFAILAGVLGWLIARNAGPFFRSRTEAIQSGIREAALAREEAEKRAAGIESRVANLSAEVEDLRRQSREEINREGERVRAETEVQIRKIQAQAEAEIASAAKHASQELKAYSAQLALGMAEQQIRNRMTPQAQDQLTDTFVDELRQEAKKAVMN